MRQPSQVQPVSETRQPPSKACRWAAEKTHTAPREKFTDAVAGSCGRSLRCEFPTAFSKSCRRIHSTPKQHTVGLGAFEVWVQASGWVHLRFGLKRCVPCTAVGRTKWGPCLSGPRRSTGMCTWEQGSGSQAPRTNVYQVGGSSSWAPVSSVLLSRRSARI